MPHLPAPTAYAVGQLWACKGRHDDEQPTLLINRIDQHPLGGGNIYHVTFDGLKIRHPGLPGGYMTRLAHAPVTAQTLERSQLRFVGERQPDPAYLQGYAQWREALMRARPARSESAPRPFWRLSSAASTARHSTSPELDHPADGTPPMLKIST